MRRAATRRGRRSGTDGFTLLEVVSVAGLLGAGILAVAHIAVDSVNLKQCVQETEVARTVVDQELQALQATSFFDLRTVQDGRGFTAVQDGVSLEALPGDPDGLPGLVSVTIPDPPDDPAALMEVTVRVDWSGRQGPRSMVRTLRISQVGAVR